MNHARIRLAAIALGTTLAAGLAGCAGPSSGDDPAVPADPKGALAASTIALREGNYAFSMTTPQSTGRGVVHLPSKSATMEMVDTAEDGHSSLQVRFIDTDRYLKMTMDTSEMTDGLADIDTSDPKMAEMVDGMRKLAEVFSGKTWMHVDATKLEDRSEFTLDPAEPDLSGVSTLVASVVTEQGDGRTVTGTLDGSTAGDDGLWDAEDFDGMGAAAKAIPYTATIDGQGRLTKLVLDAPKSGDIPAGPWTFQLSGYGAQIAQEKPDAAEVEEMPASAYKMMNR